MEKIRKGKGKKKGKKEVLEGIRNLFGEADKVFLEDSKLADKYVERARRMGMKNKVRIPRELKRKFCKYCYGYLRPGVNCRVRTRKGRVVYYCLRCKKYMRFVL